MSKIHIDIAQCRAFVGGVDAMLTAGEFRVVAKLVEHAGSFVSYRTLYDVLQSPGFIAGTDADGYKVNVRSQVKRIRKKFGALDASAWNMIENYQAVGYRIAAEHIQGRTCCPTCGNLIIKMAAVTVPASTPAPATLPETVPDYATGLTVER